MAAPTLRVIPAQSKQTITSYGEPTVSHSGLSTSVHTQALMQMSTSAFLLCFYLFPRAPRQAPRGLQDSLLQNIHLQVKIRPQLSHHNSWCSRDSIKGVQCIGQCFACCCHDKALRKGLNEKPKHWICTCRLID